MSETWIWDRYWHFDRIASCFDDEGTRNYEDRVAASWRAFFAELPAGTQILDLCTGNGAIAIMAAEVSRDRAKAFSIVAVDQADIDPRSYVTKHTDELAAIQFHPGVAVERLPFSDGSFGAVVSQYGIEYSDLIRSIAELTRVVAPGGHVRLVMHAAEGSVVDVSKRLIADVDFLLDGLDLAGLAQRCFAAVTAVERKPGATEDERRIARDSFRTFEDALRLTGDRIVTAADPRTLRNSAATLLDAHRRRGNLEVGQLLAIAERVRIEDQAHRARLTALVEAAISRVQRQEFAGRLRRMGAKQVKEADFVIEDALVGHLVEARF